MTVTEVAAVAARRIPRGTIMRRPAAPCEAFVVVTRDVEAGEAFADVRYMGGIEGAVWTERVADLAPLRCNAVAF